MHLSFVAFTKFVQSGCYAYTGYDWASPLLGRNGTLQYLQFGMAYCIDGIGVDKLMIGKEGFELKCRGERH